MVSRAGATTAGLLVLALVGACDSDHAAERVSLKRRASPAAEATSVSSPPPSTGAQPSDTATVVLPPVISTSGVFPSMAPSTGAQPSDTVPIIPPPVIATSLATPMATSPPLPVSGPPRFFVTARHPLFYFPQGSKTAISTPVRPAVHDAKTGAFVADIPLPPGVLSSWQLVAAAPDNRTFVLSGWTGPDSPIRFFRVSLAENGQPGDPMLIPGFESDKSDPGSAVALSPDGSRLAYASVVIGGEAKVSVVDVATGQRRDWITRTPSTVSGLAWAPDGRRLAMVVWGWGVGVLDLGWQGSDLLAGARLVRPAQDSRLLHSVAYTPDGSALIYSASHDIERVPVDGGEEPRVLARLTLPPASSGTLPFSVDGTGRYLLYVNRWRSFRVDLVDGSTTSVPIKVGEHSGEGDSPQAAW
ncbi:hypothetical protein [Planotetraspora sp. GP83]|uniref:WD40 repeat domain-containing protein n=1 Tax=Planotetraspora sp. GP83 TaxID=3156264 RepID=UPI0035148E84